MLSQRLAVGLIFLMTACGGGSALPDEEPAAVRSRPVGRILDEVPQPVDTGVRYVIYLHNAFAERSQPGEHHPEFGVYRMQAILDVFAEHAFTVIAKNRESQADVRRWARDTAGTVRQLLDSGVPPEKITVVGFSKGGTIAILTSSELREPKVNYVFLAACGDWVHTLPGLRPTGRMLSIREASDQLATSCSDLFTSAPESSRTHELVIDVGGGHGAFFEARPEWVTPTVDWARGLPPPTREP